MGYPVIYNGESFALTHVTDLSDTDGWSSTHYLSGDGVPHEKKAVYENGCWVSRWTAADTSVAALAEGDYEYQIHLTGPDGQTGIAEQGRLEVREPSSETGTVARTATERMLGNVEAALLELTKSPSTSVSVGGQSYSFADRNDLLDLRNRLRNEVASERRAEQGMPPQPRGYLFQP